jgi:AAA+ ATPase superfamily predicted ATPase
MAYENYFPRGIATGEAFCNRVNERKRLALNIKTGQHTLLMSPRRYGKTSLVRFVIDEMELPFGEADLFVAIDAKRIEQRILSGIKMVFANSSNSMEQTLRLVRDYFKTVNSKWVIGTQGLNIALIPSQDSDPATNVMDALLALENVLAQKKKRAVIFLDEIQEIGEIAEGKAIEGAIRHAAQESKYLSMVFSGSSRHLLSKMFFNKSRPLYKLCDRITLDHISEEDYEKHLNKLAKKRWGMNISQEALSCLFSLTERHPFYMNNLCLRIWQSLENPPSAEEVEQYWHDFLKEERLETARELSGLSAGQRKILMAMASGYAKGFSSKNFLKIVDMAGPSVHEALQVLEQKDYIERQGDDYLIIDPLIKASLNLYFGEQSE